MATASPAQLSRNPLYQPSLMNAQEYSGTLFLEESRAAVSSAYMPLTAFQTPSATFADPDLGTTYAVPLQAAATVVASEDSLYSVTYDLASPGGICEDPASSATYYLASPAPPISSS